MDKTQTQIVPFGKYKDQPVELMIADRNYCEWLMAQPWFAEKFRNVYNVVINHGGQPQDTPEHNALQARFLDSKFCLRVAKLIEPRAFAPKKSLEADKEKATAYREKLLSDAEKRLNEYLSRTNEAADSYFSKRYHEEFEEAKGIEFYAQYSDFQVNDIRFEVGGWDVAFCLSGGYVIRMKKGEVDSRFSGYDVSDFISQILVEAKPTVGDDYPSILRQITGHRGSHGRPVLLAGSFDARGATLEQVRKIFASRGIAIVMLDDVDG